MGKCKRNLRETSSPTTRFSRMVKARWRKATAATDSCFSPREEKHSSGNDEVREGEGSFPPLAEDKPSSCSEGSLCLSTSALAFSRLEGSCASKAQAVIGKVCQDRPNEITASTSKTMPRLKWFNSVPWATQPQ